MAFIIVRELMAFEKGVWNLKREFWHLKRDVM
jgi:hypothetical protein